MEVLVESWRGWLVMITHPEQKITQESIPLHEVNFHPHSFGDPAGRLFSWDGQLYRGIRMEGMPFFTGLFQNGLIQWLVERGHLIETERTPFSLEGYALVVRHATLPFASYPEEWCPAMLKDAALAIIELLKELAPHGLTLKDPHPWNLLFDACRPVYVDLTSIAPMPEGSRLPRLDTFFRFCLYPLLLMSRGQERIARWLLWDYKGVRASDFWTVFRGTPLLPSLPLIANRFGSVLQSYLAPIWDRSEDGRRSHLAYLNRLGHEIEAIPLPYPKNAKIENPLISKDRWTAKQRSVHQIFIELKPDSVLDIGSADGWYSRLAAQEGSRVVSFDLDSMRVNQLYRAAHDGRMPILPLVMDFSDPTPSRGLSNHWAIPATDRFQCDLVLALDLVHNLVNTRSLTFEQIAGGLARFSRRWLVIDFRQDESQDRSSRHGMDAFLSVLKQHFRSVRTMPSDPAPRVLLVCEK